jgi:hypothetical protein
MIIKEDLVRFCKIAKLDCKSTYTKEELKEIVEKYLNKYKYAPRYLTDLNREEIFEKKFDIKYNYLLEKQTGKPNYKKVSTDYKSPSKSFKYSKYTQKWNNKYKDAKTLKEKSQVSGVPIDILKKVENKGLAAWRGGQHRPGASQKSWAIARVNSFLTCGKTFYYPDHLLVKESIKRSPKSKRFWSQQGCNFKKIGKKTPSK